MLTVEIHAALAGTHLAGEAEVPTQVAGDPGAGTTGERQRHATPMVTSASICSVTRMLPSSAAIELPARAVTISAVNTGAISRVSEMATSEPTMPSAPNCRRLCVVCSASTMPLKIPVRATMKIEPTPTKSMA